MADEALQASVLVLNKSFLPVNLITAQRAFGMLFADTAEVVHIEDGQMGLYDFAGWRRTSRARRLSGVNGQTEWVRTVSFELEVPRIVRLLTYNDYPDNRVSLTRRNVLARDEHRCQYCGAEFTTRRLSIDHVVPLSRGGRTCWTNVVCACHRCNRLKGWRTPQEAGMRLIRRPREPRFDPVIRMKLQREKYQSWRAFFSDRHVRRSAE